MKKLTYSSVDDFLAIQEEVTQIILQHDQQTLAIWSKSYLHDFILKDGDLITILRFKPNNLNIDEINILDRILRSNHVDKLRLVVLPN